MFDWKACFTRKRLARKSCCIEKTWVFAQTSVAEKQYKDFDNVFNYDAKEESLKAEKEEPLTMDESSIFYDNKYTFSELKNVEKYMNKSLTARYDNNLLPFYQRLKEFEKFPS